MFAEPMSVFKNISLWLFGFLFLGLCLGFYLYKGSACNNVSDQLIKISSTDDADSVELKLKQSYGLKFPFAFHFIAEKMHLNKWIKEGRYTLKPGMTLIEVVNLFREGKMKTTNLVVRPLISLEKLAGIFGNNLKQTVLNL